LSKVSKSLKSQPLLEVEESTTRGLSAVECLERKELAVGSWREGQYENALILIDSVLSEELSPAVACECWVTRATFKGEQGEFEESLESLKRAAPFLDSADGRTRAAFYYERARCHRNAGDYDAAMTDYAGSAVCLEAVGLTSRQAFVENNLAWLYLQTGDFASAHDHASKAIQLNGENLAKAYETRAEIYAAEGLVELALDNISIAIEKVEENEAWLAGFLETKDRIKAKLLSLLGVTRVADLDQLRIDMTRRALIQTEGNMAQAGRVLGLSHKGIDWIITKHPELEQYRKERTTRRRSLIKSVRNSV
jgi:tetratricopeptide (TPR) repeat protein